MSVSIGPTATARPERDPARIRWLMFVRDRGIFVLWAALLALFSLWASPYFASLNNAILIANAAALTAIFAAGVAAGHLLGAVVGLINGAISLRGFNPIIVTIGTLSVMSGLAAALAEGYTIPGLDGLSFMGTERYLGVPAPVWIVAALFGVLTVFVTRTRAGIRVMAVGGNAEAVRRSGVHSDRYTVLGFIISGFCAALGGLVTTGLVTEANPAANVGIIFNALAGVALTGGRGSLPRVLVGALILGTISNGLTIVGVQPYWGTAVTGLLLVSLGLERWVAGTVSRRLVATASASAHTGTR